ncbi:hypothetical protein XANCAGTX0491_005246 [Xanthoria calcicola]
MAPFKGTWFTVLKEWHPTADDQKLSCCTIRPGEAGWVLDTNPNGWTLIKLNELKFGWVPSARLKTTEYVRDLPVKVIFEVKAIQPQGPTTSTAQSFRFAKALDDLSNWMKSSSSLDFLNQEAQNILVADSQLFNLKTSLLNGIPSRLASILNQAQYTIADLLTCEQVEPQSGSGLYARIYELAGGEYHIYIGSSINMWTRNSAHASAISRGQRSRHYNMARQALSITVIILSRTTEALLFSEQLMILLCNSYYSYMSKPPTSTTNDSAAGWIAWAWEAYVLTRVANHCFQENGWITVTEMTGANGCNVQSPAARSADREAITWVKMVNRAHTVATYRRRPCKLTMHSGAALVIFQNMRLQVPLLPGSEINEDTVVYTVFERRLDGKPHAKPMCRLPLVGGYTDWREISTLACRVEWQTSKGWKAMYLQRVYLTENLMPINRYPPRAYRDASAILAALKGQVYTNPSPWRMQITSWKTVSVWWDQIHQQLRVLEDWQREQLPEPALRSLGEVGNELRALGFRVASTKPSGGSWRDGCDTCYMAKREVTDGPNPEKSGKYYLCQKSKDDAPACDRCLLQGRPCTWTWAAYSDFLLLPRFRAVGQASLDRTTNRFDIDTPVFVTGQDDVSELQDLI